MRQEITLMDRNDQSTLNEFNRLTNLCLEQREVSQAPTSSFYWCETRNQSNAFLRALKAGTNREPSLKELVRDFATALVGDLKEALQGSGASSLVIGSIAGEAESIVTDMAVAVSQLDNVEGDWQGECFHGLKAMLERQLRSLGIDPCTVIQRTQSRYYKLVVKVLESCCDPSSDLH